MPMFLQRSEAAKSLNVMRGTLGGNIETILWAKGEKPKAIDIPVDSVTKTITFTFSTDTKGNRFVLTSPSGIIMTEGARNSEVTEFNCGRVVMLSVPEAGTWRADITDPGKFWLKVEGQSDIYFIKAEFVKSGGRPGHEGMFPIQGQPLAGDPAALEIDLSAEPARTTEFRLVSEGGETIKELQMRRLNSDRESLEFAGMVQLPQKPFRIAVRGVDVNGKAYQRFVSRLFHAESVEVTPKLDFDELPVGSTKNAVFVVRNTGVARTFKVSVTDTHGFVSHVEASSLELRSGESSSITVQLTVREGANITGGDDLVTVVSSTSGPATSNSSVVHLAIVQPGHN